jgi:hypothetical protein
MTSASDFDRDSYLRDVIEPAVARRLAPRDLLARYAITSECTHTASAFRRRVDEVEKYWRSIQLQHRYQKLIAALMVAHHDLADRDQLTHAAFVRRRDEDRARALDYLETRARDLAVMTDVAGPDMLDALRAEIGCGTAARRYRRGRAVGASTQTRQALSRLGRAAQDPGADAGGRGRL